MRKTLLLLAVILLVLIVAVAGIGYLLPVEHVATRGAVVARRPGIVHAVLTDVHAFPAWRSGLTGVDVIEVGKRWRERSDDGDITFELVESRPPDRLVTRIADDTLPFGGTWTFDLTPDQNGTRVTITENGQVFNPVFRFMSRFIFGHSATIETYLADLEKRIASMPEEGARQKSAVQPDAAETESRRRRRTADQSSRKTLTHTDATRRTIIATTSKTFPSLIASATWSGLLTMSEIRAAAAIAATSATRLPAASATFLIVAIAIR